MSQRSPLRCLRLNVRSLLAFRPYELVFVSVKHEIEGRQRSKASRDVCLHFRFFMSDHRWMVVYFLLENPKLLAHGGDFFEERQHFNFFDYFAVTVFKGQTASE